ncbi:MULTISPECIES: hypothetical protein [unclassified Micromonospora]|uniref:hypothetical protein n=1 Tax=unclassified Micromonospora TaxID=2617518 RepID=UPI001C23AEE9|nr:MULTISPECIES: hypothetical protein [unclassified Micromonospora]MBU8855743.1 hypothetical protein [Micromonospora sp. WMMB482]MBU8857628.1 hypothetical protein [Micromonospora sp. WMMB482]MDM4777742.1 hypothetical protein [Micromonospora sp. b486]MDM4783255.1 hypothetical protein [Micromonospora sp. b486]MDM4784405.1 hypothetical protein [Micromonospora sp. b486]
MTALRGTRTRRAVAAPAAALVVLAGLTSCTPEVKGVTGLTVDAHGRPHAALAWCADRPPDLVVLTSVAESASPGAPTPERPYWPRRKYDVPRDATTPALVPLEGFPPGPVVEAQAAFRVSGATHDNSFRTEGVDFRIAELAELRPDSVLVTDFDDSGEVLRTVPLDEFTKMGEKAC